MTRRARAALFVVWVGALGALTWFIQRDLVIGADLRLFLPKATTPEQQLLLDEIGEGPASRILAVALDGAAPEELANVSRELAARLRADAQFRLVANGETSLEAIPPELLAYRYLLSPTLDAQRFDAQYLKSQLEQRSRDLASPAGAFLEEWLPRDPTLELLKVAQSWEPMQAPRREFDVWFDREGRRALLLVETQAPAFDPDRQRTAISALRSAFNEVNTNLAATMQISGAGAFSVLMEARTRGDARRLGVLATIGMLTLLAFAYRRVEAVILSSLPLASAGVAGLAAVSALFEAVHGITLAFGFTLIGVAQDYPIHLLSHRHSGRSSVQTARALWPTLATGVASTCIAYLTFWFSGVVGLQQLALFTVVGLAIAGITTRFGLPRLMGAAAAQDPSEAAFVMHTQRTFAHSPHPRWLIVALPLVCLGLIAAAKQPFWENDLSRLTPVPEDLLRADQTVRSQLGAPDVRYMLALEARDPQAALEQLEALRPRFERLIAAQTISGYDDAARYLPSTATQLRRQQQLPDAASLRAALEQALRETPFRSDVFEPFLSDVEQARRLPPLTLDALRDTPLAGTLELLLTQHAGRTLALVTFSGVRDVGALQAALPREAGMRLLDLKSASESLVAAQREHMLWSLAFAAVLLVVVVAVALRNASRVVRVITPMALTTLFIVAVLQTAGVSLTLFHLIALVLAAGLGLDYALFFEHSAHDPIEQRRTLHSILVSSASTLLVFALLATSRLPVLQAIGVTVSIGVLSNFVLALLITHRRATRA